MSSILDNARTLGDSLQKMRSLLPLHVQREMAEQDAKEARLIEQVRRECADVISEIADALRYPCISRSHLEQARKSLEKALSIAAVLDPE